MENSKIFAEMITHIPLCTHICSSDVLVLGEFNEDLKLECKKHDKESKFVFETEVDFEKFENKSFDTIILNEENIDFKVVSNVFRVLKDDGLVVFTTSSYFKDSEKLKNDLELFGDKFWIVMPYSFGHTTCIIASRKYHPTADLNLQRADFLEDMDYYSAEIHNASFVFPALVHKSLTGIAKR